MAKFKITFIFDEREYLASVDQAGNIYTVVPYDHHLRQRFGQVTLLESNDDFAWLNPGPGFYQFALSIVFALKRYLA